MKSGKGDGVPIGTNLTHPKIGVSDKGQNRGAVSTKSQTLVARGNLCIIVPDGIFNYDTDEFMSQDDQMALHCMLRAADRLHRPTQVLYKDLREMVSNHATAEEVFQAIERKYGPQV